MPFKCFAMIKASADGDSEAQREEQQPQVPAKEGAHYWEYFSSGQRRGSVQAGGGSSSSRQESCSTSLQQNPSCQLKEGLWL